MKKGDFMKTLVVYYSKTGTTKTVAEKFVAETGCDFDELKYDEDTKNVSFVRVPSDYERIILLAPVWAFSLAEPMKQYIAKHKDGIKRYDLIVTCGGLGLRGCVKNCLAILGTPPEHAVKIRAKDVKAGKYDISAVL
jgi:flavodoxin